MIARRLPLMVAGSALVLAACGGGSSEPSADEVTPAPTPAATEAPASPTPTEPVVEDAGAPAADAPTATTVAPPATAAAGDSTDAAEAPVAVPAALNFTAPLVGGGEIEMGQFAGRPVLLWFWAPWWSTCNREAPSVEEAKNRWDGQVEIVGVAWSGDEGQYESFIDRYGLTFPQINDSSADVFTSFEVFSQPAFAIITPEGEVQTLMGAADSELLDSIISDALA